MFLYQKPVPLDTLAIRLIQMFLPNLLLIHVIQTKRRLGYLTHLPIFLNRDSLEPSAQDIDGATKSNIETLFWHHLTSHQPSECFDARSLYRYKTLRKHNISRTIGRKILVRPSFRPNQVEIWSRLYSIFRNTIPRSFYLTSPNSLFFYRKWRSMLNKTHFPQLYTENNRAKTPRALMMKPWQVRPIHLRNRTPVVNAPSDSRIRNYRPKLPSDLPN